MAPHRASGLSGKIRADVAVYRVVDLPEAGTVFRLPPVACVEVLSDDALHDLAAGYLAAGRLRRGA